MKNSSLNIANNGAGAEVCRVVCIGGHKFNIKYTVPSRPDNGYFKLRKFLLKLLEVQAEVDKREGWPSTPDVIRCVSNGGKNFGVSRNSNDEIATDYLEPDAIDKADDK